MKTGHLIAIFAVALLAALAAAFGTWYLQEEEGASAAEGGAHIAVEESVDLLFGQSTVLSPVLIGEDGSIRSDAVFEFSCTDEADAAYLKFDNVQQGKVAAVGCDRGEACFAESCKIIYVIGPCLERVHLCRVERRGYSAVFCYLEIPLRSEVIEQGSDIV